MHVVAWPSVLCSQVHTALPAGINPGTARPAAGARLTIMCIGHVHLPSALQAHHAGLQSCTTSQLPRASNKRLLARSSTHSGIGPLADPAPACTGQQALWLQSTFQIKIIKQIASCKSSAHLRRSRYARAPPHPTASSRCCRWTGS